MISITDHAIVLDARKHAETSALVTLLTHKHGVYKGVVRGAFSKKNRGVYQPGNLLSATWSARIPEQLGNINAEMLSPFAALIMQHRQATALLSSACALLAVALPERHSYPKIYSALAHLLTHLTHAPDECLEQYIQFELLLLAETGFGLDLSACAATGTTENLTYVSPKSGRAVSASAGEPYKERMLKLPPFLLPSRLTSPRKALPLEGGGLGGGELTNKSRELRKNQTDAEKKLWHYLQNEQLEGYKFRRQHPMGERYIVDFICLEKRLIIELDGGQHAQQQAYDAQRTQFLEMEGYTVLRFWNNEVIENAEGVWEQIHTVLLSPPPQPSPLKGEGDSRTSPPSALDDGLRLTSYFLEHWLFESLHRKMPAARKRLQNLG